MFVAQNIIYILFVFSLRIVLADKCNSTLEKPVSLQIKDLVLCDYDKTVRPVIHNNATSLEIKFFVRHFDYEKYQSLLDVEAWFGMRWKDDHIHWDPDKYKGVESVFLTSDDIWTPNLAIYNRGSYANSKIIQNKAECLVFYHKRIICLAQSSIRGMCRPDLRYYPFDVQNCTLRIGSWFHTDSEINIMDVDIITNINTLALNPEWKLDSVKYEKVTEKSKNYPNETFSSLKFHFLIRRNSGAIFATILVPYLVLIGLSIVILWLDPESTDRIYSITIVIPLEVMFTLNTYYEITETGDSVPYLIQIIRNSQLIATFTLIETILVRYFLQKTDESPKFLVNTFNIITKYKIGQLLVFSELNPENAAENLTADDCSNLVEMKERPKEWYLFGKVIDRLTLVITMITYLSMFIQFIPKP